MNLIRFRELFRLDYLLTVLIAGMTGAVFLLMIELSFAVLIFSGDLSGFTANGIGLALFGTVVITLVVALSSSFSGSLASPQDSPAAILALISAAITSGLQSASPQEKYITVLLAIIVTSVITGIFFFILGRFRLGGLVRYVPYPVVGGFLAGTGWLLIQGAINVMTGLSVHIDEIPTLFRSPMLLQWLPGTAFGVLILFITRRYSRFWVMPAILIGGFVIFYLTLAAMHIPLSEAGQRGWLLGPFPKGALWQPLPLAMLPKVNWGIIFGQIDKISTIVVISVVSLLLNSSGIELATHEDMDLNRELQSAGFANILAGLGGGMVGYHVLSDTIMMHKMGSRGRVTGIVIAFICACVLAFGASLLTYFPRPFLGGLLLFLGLSFVVEWVYDAWFKLPLMEYALVLIILVIVSTVGFLQGVAAGFGIAGILFIVNYSHINVIKYSLSGANFHSRVDRPVSQTRLLRVEGDKIGIFSLQGFIFFGTAQILLDQCRLRILGTTPASLKYLVLDFRQVTGLDTSAVSSFMRLKQLAASKNITLIITQLSAGVRQMMLKGGIITDIDGLTKDFEDLDYGIEWCENQLLADAGRQSILLETSLEKQIQNAFRFRPVIKRFFSYLEKQELPANHYIIRQGEPADAIYFIESGSATAQLELPSGQIIRLRLMRSGTFVGEIGLYLDHPRTASVITIQPSSIYRLSRQALEQIEETDAQVAAALHQFLAHQLAERLAENNSLIESLMR
jgi:SulP family sulfate permease